MAEFSPAPSPAFSGIDFNPAFFPSTTSDYLEFPVAQGTETFGTIFATTIDTPTPSADFDFLDSAIGNINIGTSVPTLKTIKLGADTGTTVQCGSIALQDTSINNAVASNTGTISLGPAQTTGTLNIGTHPTTGTRTTGGINIGTNSVGVTPIIIGTTGQTTTTLRGTTVDVVTKLTTPSLDATLATTNMTIGSNLRGGNLTIGGSSGHTGTINIGSGQTKGALNIGNGARTGTATINIGTQAELDANMGINIGTPSNTYTNLYGYNVGVETQMSAPIINAKTFGTAMTIGANLTSGTLSIGGTAHAAEIALGSGQTSGNLNIGTGQRDNASNINIGTGANSSTAGGNIYIGHISTSGTSAQAVKINTGTGTGGTTIGSGTSATTVAGQLTVSGKIINADIESTDAATAMTIGDNLRGGSLTIGGSSGHTGDVSLAAGQTTGDLYIGTAARTAASDINIGTGANGAGNIYIGHKTGVVSTQAVKINTSATTGATGATTIGSLTSATSIGGTLSVVTKVSTPIIDCITDAGSNNTSLSIGPSATSGNIVIGAALGTGDISIATAQSSGGTVTIGSNLTETTIKNKLILTGLSSSLVIFGNTTGDYVDTYPATGTYVIPTTINREFFLIANAGITFVTLPTGVVGQIINIKNQSTGSQTINSAQSVSIFPAGTNSGASTYSLPSGGSQRFYFYTSGALNVWMGF